MNHSVRLEEIVDALEMLIDEASSFVNLDTGEVETVSKELLSAAEEGEDDGELDLPEWQEAEWELAKRIVASDRFEELPSKFDVHEWEIMREFSEEVEPAEVRADLLNAIHGREAFRSFKDALRRNKIEEAWYSFRTEALREIAIEWCEEHQIPWE
ncbi:MAG: hypothetical protein JWP63_582 [Candidatus Solibacter sp.]|nr:hypothetical protein [Candidatus Solibacter sp.]